MLAADDGQIQKELRFVMNGKMKFCELSRMCGCCIILLGDFSDHYKVAWLPEHLHHLLWLCFTSGVTLILSEDRDVKTRYYYPIPQYFTYCTLFFAYSIVFLSLFLICTFNFFRVLYSIVCGWFGSIGYFNFL